MSVQFYTQREFPAQLKSLSGFRHYGDWASDLLNAGANLVQKASPWDLLKGVFVDKPIAQAQAQEAEAQIQAQAVAMQQAEQQSTLRMVLLVGAGLAGALLVVAALKPPAAKKMSGYHRRNRRARR
jgi:hypothetical protein